MQFETLAWGELYQPVVEQGISFITNLDEASELLGQARIQGLERVRSINYDTRVVMVLSLGSRPSTGWAVTISRIVHDGRKLTVHAVETVPYAGGRIITYPIQVVSIAKTDTKNRCY
jgi:hypothetical protein